MPSLRHLLSSLRGHVRLRTIAFVLIAGALVVVAAPPPWWSGRGVTNQNAADDYAPINQGQLKNLLKAAVQELDSTLPGGAGDTLHAMITRWATPTAQTDDYAAVNLGQLKAAAAPVYDRLSTIGY
ncbi:MAG: sugar-binding protein, partial [Chthoniobacteraceae bacterium]